MPDDNTPDMPDKLFAPYYDGMNLSEIDPGTGWGTEYTRDDIVESRVRAERELADDLAEILDAIVDSYDPYDPGVYSGDIKQASEALNRYKGMRK